MRVSRRFALGRTQPTLDFVDVRTDGDTPLFISPSALAGLPSPWGHECVSVAQNFFSSVLRRIRENDDAGAERLLSALREPNETHLGLSRGRPRGRALGDDSAHRVWAALRTSEAAKSGLLQDLEETVLLIPGIGVDIVSDMTTNIIRNQLIHYTQVVCGIYEIPLQTGVASGPIWNPNKGEWDQIYVDLPVTPEGRLLLVPKAIVRSSPLYNLEEYFRHYLLVQMQYDEFEANTSLVRVLRDGSRALPHKTTLMAKYGSDKESIVEQTLLRPDVLQRYAKAKAEEPYLPLDHEQIAGVQESPLPNWPELLEDVISVVPGNEGAAAYERAIEALLSALFYPDLTNPIPQHSIHNGRKRIDITYTNVAAGGFFRWLSQHYPAPFIYIECKKYSKDVANEELDQISGRFSPSRGRVGFIVSREFRNKALFLKRCRDTAKDDRGFVIALDDDDLRELVQHRADAVGYQDWPLLMQRMHGLLA